MAAESYDCLAKIVLYKKSQFGASGLETMLKLRVARSRTPGVCIATKQKRAFCHPSYSSPSQGSFFSMLCPSFLPDINIQDRDSGPPRFCPFVQGNALSSNIQDTCRDINSSHTQQHAKSSQRRPMSWGVHLQVTVAN